MKPFQTFFESAENGIVVYHGTRETDLSHLQGGAPPYAGGIGSGVYVGTRIETAQFYGPHVYELRTSFGWDQVFQINEDNYEVLAEGNTILVGEHVLPFSFEMNGNRYAVVEGTGWASEDNWVVREYRARKLFELLAVEEHNGLHATEHSPPWIEGIIGTLNQSYQHGDFPDIDDFDDELYQWADQRHMGGKWPGRDLGRKSYLPGQTGDLGYKGFQDRSTQWSTQLENSVEKIRKQLERVLLQANQAATDIGELISMEEIGGIVEQAGYPAVHVEGIRYGAGVNEEMLVFSEDDLKFIKQVS